jgi:hypothetical protein
MMKIRDRKDMNMEKWEEIEKMIGRETVKRDAELEPKVRCEVPCLPCEQEGLKRACGPSPGQPPTHTGGMISHPPRHPS